MTETYRLRFQRRLTWAILAVGLALRVGHYLANHTIWYDEAVLLGNILGKNYAELLGPLDHAVAAPPIFLWGLKLLSQLCGDVPYRWRFVPFACSCGALLLTVPLTRRVFTPTVALFTLLLVALSDNAIWLGCSIKPYAGDALIATGLLYFYEATRNWTATKRLGILAFLIPPILCTSYPAAFILGGLLLALLPIAFRERLRGLSMWSLAAFAALATFAILYFGPVKNQRVEGLVNEWERMYPEWHNSLSLPWWLLEHTSTIFQFCFNPVGFYLFAVAPFGIIAAWRNRNRDRVILLATPFLLAIIAASLKAYPFGFNRLMYFIAPCALLLGGMGIEALMRWFPQKWIHVFSGIALIAAALILPIVHIAHPWDRPDSSGIAAHIRSHRRPGDRVATDEQTYTYFFRGELESLNDAANAPPGSRLWVPMDHYTPEVRRGYVGDRLAPAGWKRIEEVEFKKATVFLWER